MTSDRPTMFESVVCGRCGGCGQYSWNAMHGSRCYGCGGRGRKLTKRGVAAQEFYRALLSKRADQLEVGDRALIEGNPIFGGGGWMTVGEVEVIDWTYRRDGEEVTKPAVRIRFDHKSGDPERGITHANESPEKLIRIAATREEKVAARDKALAFQATLTKQGKPRKRAAAAA